MKNITKLFAIATVVLGFATTSFAQTSSTATSTASATILTPIAIANSVPLNFGTIGAVATASTVILAADDSRTTTGGATLFTVGAPAKAGVFGITGTPNATFAITLPSTVSITGLGTPMNITNWVSDLGATNTIQNDGTKPLVVSATLNVGASQAAGTYTGSYAVTVNYN